MNGQKDVLYTHTHTHTMEYYSVKKRNNAIRTNMVEPRDYHTKGTKTEKDKYHIIYMWNLKI